ncbi:MAG: lipoate--protein ligase [Bdellovibrionota bacterium]
MTKIRILTSSSFDPWFNLATEEWIFREMDPSVQTLFLWRNDNTVVIGRNQNPWSECNLAKLEKDGVRLARRTSGGGAVYQDLGNTCFTFLSPKEGYDRAVNSTIILRALEKFGIRAEASGRNDLVVPMEDGPRKFSGSAFRETRDRAFHHGTVLMSANLSRLADYLTPHPKKMQSKGRASVRSRVMNLNEIAPSLNHDSLCPAIIETFCSHYGSKCEVEPLDPVNLATMPGLKERYEELMSWDWRFGHAPQFTQQLVEYLSWGFIDLHLDSEHGRITRVALYSDSLFPALIEGLRDALEGRAYTKAGIAEAVSVARDKLPDFASELAEFESWMQSQVEI